MKHQNFMWWNWWNVSSTQRSTEVYSTHSCLMLHVCSLHCLSLSWPIQRRNALIVSIDCTTNWCLTLIPVQNQPAPEAESEEPLPLDGRVKREALRKVRKAEHADDYLHSYKFKNSIQRRFSRSQDTKVLSI